MGFVDLGFGICEFGVWSLWVWSLRMNRDYVTSRDIICSKSMVFGIKGVLNFKFSKKLQ